MSPGNAVAAFERSEKGDGDEVGAELARDERAGSMNRHPGVTAPGHNRPAPDTWVALYAQPCLATLRIKKHGLTAPSSALLLPTQSAACLCSSTAQWVPVIVTPSAQISTRFTLSALTRFVSSVPSVTFCKKQPCPLV